MRSHFVGAELSHKKIPIVPGDCAKTTACKHHKHSIKPACRHFLWRNTKTRMIVAFYPSISSNSRNELFKNFICVTRHRSVAELLGHPGFVSHCVVGTGIARRRVTALAQLEAQQRPRQAPRRSSAVAKPLIGGYRSCRQSSAKRPCRRFIERMRAGAACRRMRK
jgi:hypothetical protein